MTYKELVKAISYLEGKKVEVPVGNIREILRVIKLLSVTDSEFMFAFMKYLTK